MSKKILIISLIALLLIGTATAIILTLPKKALAQTDYAITVITTANDPMPGVTVHFFFSTTESYDRVTNALGKAYVEREGDWHTWEASVTPPENWQIVSENPQTFPGPDEITSALFILNGNW